MGWLSGPAGRSDGLAEDQGNNKQDSNAGGDSCLTRHAQADDRSEGNDGEKEPCHDLAALAFARSILSNNLFRTAQVS